VCACFFFAALGWVSLSIADGFVELLVRALTLALSTT
jgi:hypothetical protein